MKKELVRKLIAGTVGLGFALSASPVFAWYLYSYDANYKKECHWFTDPIEGTSSIVCGKWQPALANPRGSGGMDLHASPKEFATSATLSQIPKEYESQVLKAARAEHIQLTRDKVKVKPAAATEQIKQMPARKRL